MLQRFFTHPIELTINNKSVMFNSLSDFEFALNARTAIPLGKITDSIKASLQDLQEEAEAIAIAEDKLANLMSRSPETSDGIAMRLKSIDSSIFSKDNDWRDIITGLNSNESFESCKYKQAAVKIYLKYLSNRLGMIKSIRSELEKNRSSASLKSEHLTLAQVKTGSFEVSEELDPTLVDPGSGMTKMPKGRAVIFNIKQGDKIELIISRYECRLLIEDDVKFLDSNGTEFPIKRGDNKVGRGQDCSVKFSSDMHEISRFHLMIANYNNKCLKLTDLSTHGTYYRHISS